MAEKTLILPLDGEIIGAHHHRKGRLVYVGAWRLQPDASPPSLAVPLAAAEYPHTPVNAFL